MFAQSVATIADTSCRTAIPVWPKPSSDLGDGRDSAEQGPYPINAVISRTLLCMLATYFLMRIKKQVPLGLFLHHPPTYYCITGGPEHIQDKAFLPHSPHSCNPPIFNTIQIEKLFP